MSALYDYGEKRKKEAQTKANKAQRKTAFSDYTSVADPERSNYYRDLERQYSELQGQLDNMDPSGFGNWITGNNERIKAARRDVQSQMSNIESLLTKSKAAFGALDRQQAPELSPQMLARLEALEQESQMGPLVTDPLFQGDRATLVQGGARALAGLGSAQKISRFGTGGAGSVQDVYDRLGVQLSNLGQQSRAVKEEKRDIVAQAYQAYDDAVTDFENAAENAEAAIISGNIDQAMRFMEIASQAEAKMREAQAATKQAIVGNVLGAAVQAGASALGGPASGAVDGGAMKSQAGGTINSGGSYFGNQYGLGVKGLPSNLFQPTVPVGRP